MNSKAIVSVVLALVLIGLGVYLFSGRDEGGDGYTATTSDTTSAPFRVEPNVIVVTDQRPGTEVAASLATFEKDSGFVVIHEDDDGEPGAVLGASALLSAGDNADVPVVLSRAARDGERLYAMLHADTNGNGAFDAAIDAPVQSTLGGPLMGWFEVSADAATSTPVTI